VYRTLRGTEWRFHNFEVHVESIQAYIKHTLNGCSYNDDDDEADETDEEDETPEFVSKLALCKVYDVEIVEEDENGDELEYTYEEVVIPIYWSDNN
jgi:hypothetical protein